MAARCTWSVSLSLSSTFCTAHKGHAVLSAMSARRCREVGWSGLAGERRGPAGHYLAAVANPVDRGPARGLGRRGPRGHSLPTKQAADSAPIRPLSLTRYTCAGRRLHRATQVGAAPPHRTRPVAILRVFCVDGPVPLVSTGHAKARTSSPSGWSERRQGRHAARPRRRQAQRRRRPGRRPNRPSQPRRIWRESAIWSTATVDLAANAAARSDFGLLLPAWWTDRPLWTIASGGVLRAGIGHTRRAGPEARLPVL